MRCGVTRDSYSTVRSLSFVLPSGTVVDTAAPGAAERFAAAEPELCEGLAAIRDEIRGDADLRGRIERKFAIKNTTGYRLCAFLDADEPLEIFRRLLVGSEGTLAFISEVVFETVPVPPRTSVAWVHFPSIDAAADPVGDLVAAGASAVELMVAPALMVAAGSIAGTPTYWSELDPASAVLLVELPGAAEADLAAAEARAAEVLAEHELGRPVDWARDAEAIEVAWTVREGMHGLIGRFRPPGSALIVEDVCVPPARIAECAGDLQALLGEHGFLQGVAGHTSAGNLHFMLTPDFSRPEDVARYEALIAGLVDLIVDKYDGSLKAEHGTGVSMAPFVEREWGATATDADAADQGASPIPPAILAPGVLLNDDPDCHLRDLKTTPEIEASVTTCVECGFCEPVCPSRDLTTTPRQRIVLRREIARQPSGSPVAKALSDQYRYDGLDTCAADGTCAIACPLGIDTGELVKELRGREHSKAAVALAGALARSPRATEAAARNGVAALGRLPARPRRLGGMPAPPPRAPATQRAGASAVYMPACVNRVFGRADRGGEPAGLTEALVAVSARAGRPLWIPDDVGGSCCATPWGSKGFTTAADRVAEDLTGRLGRWSGGRLPIVTDASTCALALSESTDLQVIDSIDWALSLVPGLTVSARLDSIAIHPSCSSRLLGSDRAMRALAAVLADRVEVPASATCCGFAGDRGFLHPELTAAATADEAAELDGRHFDAHVCANRTCEIGLERATGRPYESVVYVLERLSREP